MQLFNYFPPDIKSEKKDSENKKVWSRNNKPVKIKSIEDNYPTIIPNNSFYSTDNPLDNLGKGQDIIIICLRSEIEEKVKENSRLRSEIRILKCKDKEKEKRNICLESEISNLKSELEDIKSIHETKKEDTLSELIIISDLVDQFREGLQDKIIKLGQKL
jgi:hypothetical protein